LTVQKSPSDGKARIAVGGGIFHVGAWKSYFPNEGRTPLYAPPPIPNQPPVFSKNFLWITTPNCEYISLHKFYTSKILLNKFSPFPQKQLLS